MCGDEVGMLLKEIKSPGLLQKCRADAGGLRHFLERYPDRFKVRYETRPKEFGEGCTWAVEEASPRPRDADAARLAAKKALVLS